MDSDRFDRIARAAGQRTRRDAVRLVVGAGLGAGTLATLAGEADAKQRGKKKKRHHKPPPDRCSNVATCGQAYVGCGTTAGSGDACSCNVAVEGNTVCINSLDTCDGLVPCKNTKQCRKKVGFHFFCQQATTNAQGLPCGCGQVCVPECDNPNA